ncbi:MAG TPA: DUF1579 family protein [Blastocatellia bacterium]|nr:DUF1579 family protein [Blastocatellia bacterium]
MKTLRLVVSIGLAVGFLAGTGVSQEKKSEADKAKMMAAYYELAKPGPEHKQLESLVGTWDMEVKYWTQPGKPPMTVKGQCQNKMILGGRFLLSEAKSGEGMTAVENTIITGFDRRHKKFTTVALDTMGTYWVTAAGPYDASRKAIVMYGEDVDPALGTQKYDMVVRVVSPTSYVIEIIFKDPEHTGGQKEFKMVEVTHTKK